MRAVAKVGKDVFNARLHPVDERWRCIVTHPSTERIGCITGHLLPLRLAIAVQIRTSHIRPAPRVVVKGKLGDGNRTTTNRLVTIATPRIKLV